MNKVLVIGLDGATLDIIEPMVKKGLLPNLKEIMENGCYGILNSTTPPVSPVAWTSMVTGVNPGKHGILDFVERDNTSKNAYKLKFLCGGDRKIDAVWSYLSKKGKRSIVINIPMTYPPDEINGIMISGMDTPFSSTNYIYPQDIKDEINKYGAYCIEISLTENLKTNPKDFYNAYISTDEKRTKVATHLMNTKDWDFFMIVFMCMDRCQHFFTREWDWDALDKKIDVEENIVLKTYKKMDSLVGELMRQAGTDVTTFVVSDHGFGFAPRAFSPNKWLITNGYMVLQDRSISTSKKKALISFIKKLSTTVIVRYLSSLKSKSKKAKKPVSILTNVDWSKTTVYCEGGAPKLIINRDLIKDPKELEELKNRLIKELRDLKDTETGKNVFRRVEKGADIYTGPFAYKAADIILELDRGYFFKHFYLENFELIDEGKFIENIKGPYGEHIAEGIIMATGKHITRGNRVKDSEIIDVVPTILYLMGQQIPTDIDGKILYQLIEDEYRKNNPPVIIDRQSSEDDRSVNHIDDEKKSIEERLKNLGYL